MCPTVCRWADPGRPGPKNESWSSMWRASVVWRHCLYPGRSSITFLTTFCAVGTTKRQIPKGHLLRETGVIPFCRRLYWDFHAILILFFTCDSFLCCYWRAVNTTMTTISEFSFLRPSDHGRLIRFLFYRLRLWKVNETNQEKFFSHMQVLLVAFLVCFHFMNNSIWLLSVRDYTVIRINARLVLK